MSAETLISLVLGISLAASVGFRIFIPFLILGLSSYFDILPLNENWNWISSPFALITFGVATVVEIVAYLIPWLDNLLDTIAVPLAGIAGTIIMLSTIGDMSPVITWSLAIIAGGGTASLVKTSTSTTRLVSSTATAGFANPVMSVIETVTSFILSISAIFIPMLALVIVFIVFWIIAKLYKSVWQNKKGMKS